MRDREIIEELYNLYEQKMYYIAYSILHDEYASEDAVQDAFVKLIKNVHKLRNTKSYGTKKYIIKLVKNAAIDIYRKRKKSLERLFEKTACEPDIIGKDITGQDIYGQDLENEVIYRQDMIERLKKLPKGYADVIILREINGMSFKEIAEKSNSTVGAVRKRYERGIRMIKEDTL